MPMGITLAKLSPFGPIVGKELRVASRRKRNHLLRVAYLGGLLLFLLTIWAGSPSSYGGNVAYRLQWMNRLGQQFFTVFSFFCVICMGLISPVLTSTAINSERLGKTMPILLMTPINAWQIVSGKLFARLLIALMLIGLSLPVLAVVRLLGGVEIWQMVAVICICTSFAISSAAVGIFASAMINRTYAAILMAFGIQIALYMLAPLFFALVIEGFDIDLPKNSEWFFVAFNPVFNTALLIEPGMLPRLPYGQAWIWLPGIVVQLGFAALLLVVTAALLRRAAKREDVPRNPDPVIALPDGMQVPARAGRVVGDNPVLWRETRRPLAKGRATRWIGALLVVAALLISYMLCAANNALDERELQYVYGFIFNGLYWLLISTLSATVIAQEKESDTWTLLLTCPLSAEQIILGKLLGLARRMLWPTVLIAVHFFIFALFRVITFKSAILVIFVILSCNALWAATGVYWSLQFKKVTTAVVINLLIPIFFFTAVPLVLLIAGELLARSDEWAEVSLWYMPYYHIYASIDYLSGGGNYYSFASSYANWSPMARDLVSLPVFGQQPVWTALAGTIAVCFLHLMAAAGVMAMTLARFNRMVGRAR